MVVQIVERLKEMMTRAKQRTRSEVADLIERFLDNRPSYPQEWNDFVETRQQDEEIEKHRSRLDELDPLVNCPGEQNPSAIAELRAIIQALRSAKH